MPAANGKREPNPLSALSRWKLFDNLRRSVVAPVLTALLLLCWAMLPSPWFWSAAILSVIFLPTFVSALVGLVEKPHDMHWRQHLASGFSSVKVMFGHAALQAAFLPYESWFSLDAIVRTGWRMLAIAPQPARMAPVQPGALEHRHGNQLAPHVVLAGAGGRRRADAVVLQSGRAVRRRAGAAAVVHGAGHRLVDQPADGARSGRPQRRRRRSSCKRWRARPGAFFEDFVGAEDNWLPPDNMQEHPAWVVAHRTSPTNMGMSLLANLTAWDFGFASLDQVLARTSATFATMDRMERYHGHFYNWYDTISLVPLQPMYVSSVDSGNLAGHLLTLAPGLAALADQPIASFQTLDGIGITLHVVDEHAVDAAAVVKETHRRDARPAARTDARAAHPAGPDRTRWRRCATAPARSWRRWRRPPSRTCWAGPRSSPPSAATPTPSCSNWRRG